MRGERKEERLGEVRESFGRGVREGERKGRKLREGREGEVDKERWLAEGGEAEEREEKEGKQKRGRGRKGGKEGEEVGRNIYAKCDNIHTSLPV